MLAPDANPAAAMFMTIGKDSGSFDIQSIIPQVDPNKGELASGDIQIQLVEADTSAGTIYMWVTEGDAQTIEDDPTAKAGWFDDTMSYRLVGDYAVNFKGGEGFLLVNSFWDIDGAQEGLTVTFSGEVKQIDTILSLEMDANASGNISPVELDIQSISVGCKVDEEGNLSPIDEDQSIALSSGDIQIQLIEPDTSAGTIYMWVTEEDAQVIEDNPEAKAGWFDDTMSYRLVGEKAIKFPAGAGFLLVNSFWDGPMYVKLPCGLTK